MKISILHCIYLIFFGQKWTGVISIWKGYDPFLYSYYDDPFHSDINHMLIHFILISIWWWYFDQFNLMYHSDDVIFIFAITMILLVMIYFFLILARFCWWWSCISEFLLCQSNPSLSRKVSFFAENFFNSRREKIYF